MNKKAAIPLSEGSVAGLCPAERRGFGGRAPIKIKGFTLLELVIVLGIITIVMGGVFLTIRPNHRRNLENASLTLQADLRYAQRRAIMEGRRMGIHFEPQHNRYSIITGTPERIVRIVYLQEGVSLDAVIGPHGSRQRLMFLPRGTSTGGYTITLSNGRYQQQLTATVSGGRIAIRDVEITNH